jgi:Ca2+-binding RTX toxin-like protein
MKLNVERLEGRDMPAVSLVGNTLLASGGHLANSYQFDLVNGSLVATENGRAFSFPAASVQKLVVNGGPGNDSVSNNTSVPSVVFGGLGDDTVFGGVGADVIDGGAGRDVIYDLLGANVINATDATRDRVYYSAASTVLADSFDQKVNFFAAGRAPGAGSVVFESGVLYITPDDDGSLATVTRRGNVTVVTLDGVSRSYLGVGVVAYFGGAGDDRFMNQTGLDTVAYGGLGGNDTIVGGRGYNLLKGGGGDDTLVGRGSFNDLAGNGGRDSLFIIGPGVFRKDADDYLAVFLR